MGIPAGMFESTSSWMSSREMFGDGRGAMLEDRQEEVLEILRSHDAQELTVRQIYDALDRSVPESVIAVALGELTHRGLVERRAEPRGGRKRARQWYRSV